MMDYLVRMKVFSKVFPDSDVAEMVVADFIFSVLSVARDAVMHDGRRYVVVTSTMLREGIALFKGSERTARTILSSMAKQGIVDRVPAGRAGRKFAYSVSDRYMMTIHATPENFHMPGYSDWENLGEIKPEKIAVQTEKIAVQTEKNCRLQTAKFAVPSYYNKNNIYIDTSDQNDRLNDKNDRLTTENLPDTNTPTPISKNSRKLSTKKEIDLAFDRFWSVYPKHKNRAEARKRFEKLKLHRKIDRLLAAVRNYCADPGVAKNLLEGHLEYVKNPDTFLLTRGVEYWREYEKGGTEINKAALRGLAVEDPGANGAASCERGDGRLLDLVSRMKQAMAALGDEGDGASLREQVGRFFSEEEMAAIEANEERHPFRYQECVVDGYAKFILGVIREGDDDSAA